MELLNFVTLDTETTGFSSKDEILQCGIIAADGCVLVDTLVKTQHKTSWVHAQRIHNISPADIALNGIPHSQFIELVEEKIEPYPNIVIYNAKFDTKFFPTDFFKKHQVFCAMEIGTRFLNKHPYLQNTKRAVKQAELAGILNINIDDIDLHSAKDDAELCRRIWVRMIQESMDYDLDIIGAPLQYYGNPSLTYRDRAY